MKEMPKIDKFMTPMPHTVNADVNLKTAYDLMKSHNIRHLPVQRSGKLIGILSDRDVKMVASLTTKPFELEVEEVMTPDPFTVNPNTPLHEVALGMSENKYGCAVVTQENGKVIGIFTAVDGLRVLGELVQKHYQDLF